MSTLQNNISDYFEYKCWQGLGKKGLNDNQEYIDRLNYEIRIIKSMHFEGYFLVVSDIVHWAIANAIPVGPGRGSAAGSLVSFVLKITHLDPIKYGLIFERFLNPDRISMPDIDLDFCELKREKVIEYVQEKYGHDCVAHIGTYGSMKAKGAIRAVARALGADYKVGDILAKLTLAPIEGKPQPLSVCYDKVPKLAEYRNKKGTIESIILENAEKVEDRLRSFGTHASGIVISTDHINKIIPLYPGKDGKPTTQYEMNTVEECGLIKFDFLGLRALTTINRCCEMIEENHGVKIDPLVIPIDDNEVYQNLQKGDTAGVFQLEGSSGMRDLMLKIQPENIEDIALLVAIYRPGPLGSNMLDHYLQVRAGKAKAKYLHPDLEPILGKTDGLLIYQEQILEICKQLAGYTMGEADVMRKAVGKKISSMMATEEPKFKKGLEEYGFERSVANKLWDEIKTFAAYGFNLAHAACYGYIAYQMAWLKTHYPLEFICACLISDSDEVEKVIQYTNECKKIGVVIIPPDINHSMTDFSISEDKKAIRFGLAAIKNLGEKPVQSIIEEREANGLFKDIVDFSERVDLSKINKLKLESLILTGAFDSISTTSRAGLLETLLDIYFYKEEKKRYDSKAETYVDRIEKYNQRLIDIEAWKVLDTATKRLRIQAGDKKPQKIKCPVNPDPPMRPEIVNIEEMELIDILNKEKELLGSYVSGHPLNEIIATAPDTIEEIKKKGQQGDWIELLAVPSMIKEITTKSKKKMAYVVLEDMTGTMNAVVLPHIYHKIREAISPSAPARYMATLKIVEMDRDDDEVYKLTQLVIQRVSCIAVPKRKVEPVVDDAIIIPINQGIEFAKEHRNDSDLTIKAKTSDNNHICFRLPRKQST